MNLIEIAVEGRTATVTNQPYPIVAGNVGFDQITATFDAEWNGLSIVANFASRCKTITQPYENGMDIPWETIQHPGNLHISFAGYTNGVEIINTQTMKPIPIGEHMPGKGVEDTPATRDIIAQTLEARDEAYEAADDLDSMTASAHTVPQGSAPTAELDRTGDVWNLDIGIPNYQRSSVNDVTVNGQSVLDSDGIAALVVDEELSALSANPVANAAVSGSVMNVAVNANETLVFWRGLAV